MIKLGEGLPLSITELAEGEPLTRQAITKHLHVLEDAGLVRGARRGREVRFRIERASVDGARDALEGISRHWDQRLARLKAHVEDRDAG